MNVFIPLCLESRRYREVFTTGHIYTEEKTRGLRNPPAELVENSNVGIHVIDVVGVGGVLDDVPLLRFGALS